MRQELEAILGGELRFLAIETREQLCLTQREMGHRLQMSESSYSDMMNEARYSRLTREFPDRAGELFERNEKNAMDRYQKLLKLKAMYED